MSITPIAPRLGQGGKVRTWVSSRWKNPWLPGSVLSGNQHRVDQEDRTFGRAEQFAVVTRVPDVRSRSAGALRVHSPSRCPCSKSAIAMPSSQSPAAFAFASWASCLGGVVLRTSYACGSAGCTPVRKRLSAFDHTAITRLKKAVRSPTARSAIRSRKLTNAAERSAIAPVSGVVLSLAASRAISLSVRSLRANAMRTCSPQALM